MGNTETIIVCECCGYYYETDIDFIGDVIVGSTTQYPMFALSRRRPYCRRCASYILSHHTGSHHLKLKTLYQECQKKFHPLYG